MTTDDALRRFYEHGNNFYLLVRDNGVIVVEGPDEHDSDGPPETLLRLFMNVEDATRYRDRDRSSKRLETEIMKITLVGLWGILPKLDSLSMSNFNAPIRIEVACMPHGEDVTYVDTLHSIYELPC